MYVFIDTNIFLSFYHLTSEDLEELQKLLKLVEDQEITLLLPEQVIDETKRNRASKINDGFSNFKKVKFNITYPAYCKDYPVYADLRSTQKALDKYHSELVKNIQEDIDKKELKADLLLENLFKVAKKIKRSDKIVTAAKQRVDIGNPPGKKDSICDAVNWESLLSFVHKSMPLNLITEDSDYYSPLNANKFNEFLEEEWKQKKNSNINFF